MIGISLWTADGSASLTLDDPQQSDPRTFACSRECLVHWLRDSLRWLEKTADGETDFVLDADIVSSDDGGLSLID